MEPCQFHTTDQHLQGKKVSIFEYYFPDQHDYMITKIVIGHIWH